VDGAAGDQTDIKVREADGDQTGPGQKHVAIIQKADAAPGGETGFAEGGARETVEFSTSEMAERVAGKRVQREHDDVDAHDQSAQAYTEMAAEIVGEHGVVPEKPKKYERQIEKIAVNVLEDKGKRRFALVAASGRLADGTSRWIEKKRAVIRFAVVVARGAKPEGSGEDEQGRREFPPVMLRINERRIERRKIGPPFEVRIFKGAPRRIQAKAAKKNNDGQKFDPPSVVAQRASEPRFGQEGWRASHLGTSRVAVSKSETK